MTNTNSLYAFLRDKAKTGKGIPEIDWEKRKNEWIESIADLYKCIKKWLAPLARDGVLKYLDSPRITLSEEYIGDYEVEVLTILVGKQRIAFYPKGTLIVGAQGRIDIRGQRTVRTIILSNGKWVFIKNDPKRTAYPFNKDSFQDILAEVME